MKSMNLFILGYNKGSKEAKHRYKPSKNDPYEIYGFVDYEYTRGLDKRSLTWYSFLIRNCWGLA